MSDPRVAPSPELVISDIPARIVEPVVDLCRSPDGPRDRQLLFGDTVSILNGKDSAALVRSEKDGYCGWVSSESLGSIADVTHQVTARATHIYHDADFKSPDIASLSFGSKLSVRQETATFVEIEQGFIPRQHVRRVDAVATDPAAIAEVFLGTPYLWGGNSHLGIDCSGLIQAACLACGMPCPGDSDQQADVCGVHLLQGRKLHRNDLVFWKGHVAMVFDRETLIHANAGHMAVVFEPIEQAFERIETQGDGRPTGFRRLAQDVT